MCGVVSAGAADLEPFYTESGMRPPPAALKEAARIHRALEAQWRRVLAARAGRLPHALGEAQLARHKEALREAQRSGQQYARIFPYGSGVLAEAADARAAAIAMLPQRQAPADLSVEPPAPAPNRHVIELYVEHPTETTRRIVRAAKRWSAVDVYVIAVVDPRRPRTVPGLGADLAGARQPTSSALVPVGDAFLVRYIDFLGRRASRFGVRSLPAAVYHHQGKSRLLDEQAVLAWLERSGPTSRKGGTPR